jgi:hypothetical protein
VDYPQSTLTLGKWRTRVTLGDDPVRRQRSRQSVSPTPPPGRPGAIGDPRFATFSAVFDRRHLNFTRGTYVELELRGGEDADGYGLAACVEIDNWDPQIQCSLLACLDLSGNNVVTVHDFLLHLAEAGATVTASAGCLDAPFASNGYVDLDDILALDALLSADPPPDNWCEPPLPGSGTGTGLSPLDMPISGLLVAGKPAGDGRSLQEDRLYCFNHEGIATGTPLPPASAAPFRGNSRLVKSPDGTAYQVHATQGLVRLDDAAREIAPFAQVFGGQTVYVGVQETGDLYDYSLEGYPQGLPLLDAAFSPDDPDVIYVVPVVVASTTYCPQYEGPCPYYQAAARLTRQTDGSYQVTQVYGVEPALDPCTNTQPPSASACQVQAPCELEVDAAGHVLVLSAAGQSAGNDWLVVYDAGSAAELDRIVLTDLVPELANPTTLLASRHTPGEVYLTSELDPDPFDGALPVYRCVLDPGGDDPLTLAQTIVVDTSGVLPPAYPDQPFGHLVLATQLLEDPNDGHLHVLGLALARVAAQLPQDDPLYPQLFCDDCPLPAVAWHAVVPPDHAGPVDASPLTGSDLALPMAGLLYVPGDLTGDDWVNGADLDLFAGCLAGPDQPSPCDPDLLHQADADGDNDTDLADFARMQ